MLVLSRKVGEEIVIGDDIRVMVVAINGNRIKLGVTAPTGVPIIRSEVERIHDEQKLRPSHQNLKPHVEED